LRQTHGRPVPQVRGRESFYNDEMVQVRVIYHLQIIGEAVRGLSPEFRVKNPGIPWSDIAGMRNILLQSLFFGIDRDAVEGDLPALKYTHATVR